MGYSGDTEETLRILSEGTQEAFRRHLGGHLGRMWEAFHRRFSPPSLNTHKHQMNVEYHTFGVYGLHGNVWRMHQPIYKIITIKPTKRCVETYIWTRRLNPILGCFWVQDPPNGCPGDHAGMEPQKLTKNTVVRPSFWDSLVQFCTFSQCVFLHFF